MGVMLGYVVGVSLNKGVLYSVSWREKHFIALSILLLHSHGPGNNELESYTPSNAYVCIPSHFLGRYSAGGTFIPSTGVRCHFGLLQHL